MPHYYGQALRWWDGDTWAPTIPAVGDVDLRKVSATSVATATTLTVTPTIVNAGSPVTLTATVTGASAGSVQFYAGTTLISTDTASPWTATHAPTATTSYTAKYVANGVYLGSTSAGKSVTVKQKSTKTYVQASRSGYQWRQSSAPTKIESTFVVGTGGLIPYSSFVITGIKLQAARYHAGSGSSVITAHVASSNGTILSSKASVTLGAASGSDTPMSALIDLPDITVATGTYRIGFTRGTTVGTQWDEYSSKGTLYYDGSSQGAGSLLYEITGYIWA
ncbi:MAG: Ig-like domain repeat protein [Candidatus Aminicenantes bacterium]|nr:MAG: Ig-like domain repeat protein [Candidatus Aminicenantes bacterium]